jgi:ABC-type maltose transport system permease subunit
MQESAIIDGATFLEVFVKIKNLICTVLMNLH